MLPSILGKSEFFLKKVKKSFVIDYFTRVISEIRG